MSSKSSRRSVLHQDAGTAFNHLAAMRANVWATILIVLSLVVFVFMLFSVANPDFSMFEYNTSDAAYRKVPANVPINRPAPTNAPAPINLPSK